MQSNGIPPPPCCCRQKIFCNQIVSLDYKTLTINAVKWHPSPLSNLLLQYGAIWVRLTQIALFQNGVHNFANFQNTKTCHMPFEPPLSVDNGGIDPLTCYF